MQTHDVAWLQDTIRAVLKEEKRKDEKSELLRVQSSWRKVWSRAWDQIIGCSFSGVDGLNLYESVCESDMLFWLFLQILLCCAWRSSFVLAINPDAYLGGVN